MLFFAAAALGYGFNFPITEVCLLVVLAASFSVPAFLLNSRVPDREEDSARMHAFTPPQWMLLVGAGVGLFGVVKLSSELGRSLFSLRTVDELFSFGQENAVSIFRGEADVSLIVSLSFAAFQVATALSGIRTALKPTRGTAWAVVLIFLTGLLWSSITTQRSYILVVVTWFVSGYIAALVWKGRRTLPARSLLMGGILGGVTLFLIIFLRAIRTSGANAALSEQTLAPTRLWLAGYIPTFSAYMKRADATEPSFGLLNGVIALVRPLFGGTSADDGGESGMFYIGAGMTSNAGTSMMRMVGTGGAIWGMLTVLVLGLLCHLVYLRAARGGAIAAAGYIAVIALTMWSTNAWFLGYGRRVLALAVLLMAAGLVSRTYRRRKEPVATSQRGRLRNTGSRQIAAIAR
ncbi:hypothetical protein [Microbacterium paulum]